MKIRLDESRHYGFVRIKTKSFHEQDGLLFTLAGELVPGQNVPESLEVPAAVMEVKPTPTMPEEPKVAEKPKQGLSTRSFKKAPKEQEVFLPKSRQPYKTALAAKTNITKKKLDPTTHAVIEYKGGFAIAKV